MLAAAAVEEEAVDEDTSALAATAAARFAAASALNFLTSNSFPALSLMGVGTFPSSLAPSPAFTAQYPTSGAATAMAEFLCTPVPPVRDATIVESGFTKPGPDAVVSSSGRTTFPSIMRRPFGLESSSSSPPAPAPLPLAPIPDAPDMDEGVGLGHAEDRPPAVPAAYALCLGKFARGLVLDPAALDFPSDEADMASLDLRFPSTSDGSLYPTGASKSTLQSVSMMHAASGGFTSINSK
mmetsp:Transcript_10330/g.30452  ORF Transcript_10330/g.30452 Transcript_10330/m.30452 type:complete len:239 (-) Transcript_10330:579-1295(-)